MPVLNVIASGWQELGREAWWVWMLEGKLGKSQCTAFLSSGKGSCCLHWCFPPHATTSFCALKNLPVSGDALGTVWYWKLLVTTSLVTGKLTFCSFIQNLFAVLSHTPARIYMMEKWIWKCWVLNILCSCHVFHFSRSSNIQILSVAKL